MKKFFDFGHHRIQKVRYRLALFNGVVNAKTAAQIQFLNGKAKGIVDILAKCQHNVQGLQMGAIVKELRTYMEVKSQEIHIR